MKKLFSLLLIAVMIMGLPTLAMAKGKGKKGLISGKVTAVTDNSLTITLGKKSSSAGESQTITVPTGTPITAKDGSPAPKLADLVGMKVKIKAKKGRAKSITVSGKKKKGKKNKSAA